MTVMNAWPGEEPDELDKDEPVYYIESPEFDEVSCVDRGDNPLAEIVLIKAADPDDQEITDIAEAAIAEVEAEELRKAELPPSEDIRNDLAAEEAAILEANPEMSRADAWKTLMQSAAGRAVRAKYNRAHDARTGAAEDAAMRARSAEAARVVKRADELRVEAASMGDKALTPQEAYKQALIESRTKK